MYVYDSPYCTTNEGEGVFAIEFGRDETVSSNFNSIAYENVQNVAQNLKTELMFCESV